MTSFVRPRLRRWHRMLGLLVGLPCLLWGTSGAILAWKHYANLRPPGNPEAVAGEKTPFTLPIEQALRLGGHQDPPQAVEWRWLLSRPQYVLHYASEPSTVVVDGQRPQAFPVVDEAMARRIAQADAPPGVSVTGCRMQTGQTLVYRGDLPAYRLALSNGDEVYVSPLTGEVQAHVDNIYRVIRVAYFALHIWDVSHRPGRHPSFVLLGLCALGLVCLGLSGLWLGLSPLWPRRHSPSN